MRLKIAFSQLIIIQRYIRGDKGSHRVGSSQLEPQIKVIEDIELGASWIFMLGDFVEQSCCFINSTLADVNMCFLCIIWPASAKK